MRSTGLRMGYAWATNWAIPVHINACHQLNGQSCKRWKQEAPERVYAALATFHIIQANQIKPRSNRWTGAPLEAALASRKASLPSRVPDPHPSGTRRPHIHLGQDLTLPDLVSSWPMRVDGRVPMPMYSPRLAPSEEQQSNNTVVDECETTLFKKLDE